MTFAYKGMSLDRCTNQRKDKRWLKSEFTKETTLFCVINDGMSLFEKSSELQPIYLTKAHLLTVSLASCIYLGKGSVDNRFSEQRSVFAIDFNKLRFSTQEDLTEMGEWQRLREVTPSLPAVDASILALAKGLVHWHLSHQFCGLCGSAASLVEAGHARRCSECRNMNFPRTDPAVIMLVERMCEDGVARCLLGRQASWEKGVYSTMAGFLDPGETLEQAVIREVLEETSIIVENPQYIASQPWPFPASVMLGFTVTATSDKIDVSQDALEDAQWFSREQLERFGVKGAKAVKAVKVVKAVKGEKEKQGEENQSEEPSFKMSSIDSISTYLITAWKNKEIGKY